MNCSESGTTLKDWLLMHGFDTFGLAPYVLYARFIINPVDQTLPDDVPIDVYQTRSASVYVEALPISKLMSTNLPDE